MTIGFGLGLLKNRLPNVIWCSIYFSGPSRTKSPGLSLREKPAEVKRNSFDFSCSANCGIELFIGGGVVEVLNNKVTLLADGIGNGNDE